MDFTQLPIGTPVIWDSPDGPILSSVGYIDNFDSDYPLAIRVDGVTRWFTSDGRWKLEEEPSLRLVNPVVEKKNASSSQGDSPVQSTAPTLPDVWVQFMCAAMSADNSVGFSAIEADGALEEYKKRFQ